MRPNALPREIDADFAEVRDERRADRRSTDRRAQRHRFNTLFAATLVNHVVKPEAPITHSYGQADKPLRPGIAFDLKA